MNYQELVNKIPLSAAVFSVQRLEDGSCGEIRTVCANEMYKAIMEGRYLDDVPYTVLVPKNSSFEQFCFDAAVLGKRRHNYVETIMKGVWTDEISLPLGMEGDIGYNLIVNELSDAKDLNRRAAVSKSTAEALIRASITFVEAQNFMEGLHTVLKDMLVLSGAKNSRVFLIDHKNRSLNVLCEVIGPEGVGRHEDAVTYDRIMSLENRVEDKNALLIADEEDREKFEKENPSWGAIIRKYDINTVVLMPLRSGKELYGYVDFVNFDPAKTVEIQELVELISVFLGSEIANYLLIRRLEEMSTTDALTGLRNRNAMHRTMEGLREGRFGIVSLDLNGLKIVNDRDGHEAGDALLISAAETLKKMFYADDIYRTGGDEFIVIVPGISRESFYRKLDRFRLSVGNNDSLSFAIGAVWSDGSMNVNSAFRCADERMYEDKNRYYEAHQERRRSSYDSLTGLPSLTVFGDLAESGRDLLKAQGKQPVLVYFNYNGMKLYNEKNGFAEGDRLLKATARSLEKHFGIDHCARVAQDHFVVFTDIDGIEDRIKAFFDECAFHNGGNSLPMSAGIYADVMERVDFGTACDRAKYACDRNRNAFMSCVCWFDADLLRAEEMRQHILNSLDRAISEGWITVSYQPIIRSSNGHVCEEEALARWNDPEKGQLMPSVFIPVLEETKLIYKLDLYVLDQILLKMKGRQSAGLYVLPHSLNLSRADFEVIDIVEEIRKKVDESGIERDRLVIEITESVVGRDFDFMQRQILRFRELGFPVWMDDFGSGYSSLDLLQNLRFDLIKFDMHFLHQVEINPTSRIIMAELMKLATSLGIDTLAEGVETEKQYEFLREVGCGRMQGFYKGRPMTVQQIEDAERIKGRIEWENPEEAEYYAAIGRINLYDLSVIASGSQEVKDYYSSIPMAVIETCEGGFRITRRNRSYQEFLQRNLEDVKVGEEIAYYSHVEEEMNPFQRAVKRCSETDKTVIIDETLEDGRRIHGMIRRIAVNPVSGAVAMVVAMLAVL